MEKVGSCKARLQNSNAKDENLEGGGEGEVGVSSQGAYARIETAIP